MSRLYGLTFKEKKRNQNDQMFNFLKRLGLISPGQVSYSADFSPPFIERSNFLSRLHRFIRDCGKMKYIKFKMAEPSWRMALVPFNNKHEVIMTSQILLKTVYVLANFLILSDTFILGFMVTLR